MKFISNQEQKVHLNVAGCAAVFFPSPAKLPQFVGVVSLTNPATHTEVFFLDIGSPTNTLNPSSEGWSSLSLDSLDGFIPPLVNPNLDGCG